MGNALGSGYGQDDKDSLRREERKGENIKSSTEVFDLYGREGGQAPVGGLKTDA